MNPAYFLGSQRRQYADVRLTSTLNQRNTFAYPLTGQYLQASLNYRAFFTAGSPNFVTAQATYSRYLALGHDFYYSVGVQGLVRFARQVSYADNRALGYEYLVRGYDRYTIEGQRLGVVQQGVSYQLFDTSKIRLKGVQNPKINTIPLALYLNTFVDAGYVGASGALPANRLPNRLLGAAGLGLHLVTYYDRVFTVEYTRNIRGEGGFFFRSEFPI